MSNLNTIIEINPALESNPAPAPEENPAPALADTPAPALESNPAPAPEENPAPALADTPAPTLRETWNVKLADAVTSVESARSAIADVSNLDQMDALIEAYNTAKGTLATVDAEGTGLQEARS